MKKKKKSDIPINTKTFFMQFQRSGCGTDEVVTEPEKPENRQSACQDVDSKLLPILDTSENGFPALRSQQESKETNNGPNSDPTCALAVHDGQLTDGEDVGKSVGKNEVHNIYARASPVRVGSKGEILPYVPPYVLDVMDALPPASVSPDGRAMLEWRKSMMPYIPKHALPVFHNKYKAKVHSLYLCFTHF